MNEKLYHYCSLETFIAIISGKCLRLSELSKSNDYMERKWIMNILEEALDKSFKDEGIIINLREKYRYGNDVNNHIDYLLEMLRDEVTQSSYITCFSRKGDLLSQWRAYGDDGRGVSIGFDSKLLYKVDSCKNDIYIEDVLYDKEKQIQGVHFAVYNALTYMKDLFEFEQNTYGISDDFNKYFIEEFDDFCEVICDELAILSCYMKNPAFKEEDEVRIFYAPIISDEPELIQEQFSKTSRFNNYVLKPINFCARKDQIIGYSDLSFEKLIQRGVISEIIIGPSSRVNGNDIYYLLTKFGYNSNDIYIKQSEASYRLK
ncbi:DUF2971 domain-containing protein [Clostridium botulinum]|uniref:DUF2971 domain-containing protein n=1 Tax=Clostridium botulinum TaxID=1491 RepID=A0A6G4EBU1_CLOBO|nr:DUF2971 domain-containing protein [Clostridium botulinum]APH17647.1 hypothetical protein NPD3_3177 [Clostridium botulinum]AUM90472.1 hypothetical protein RSJ5_04035 [Clostridium botulinum]NFB13578.1 DUF2971 domain-containing protein [Clostridium botulinum]NFH56945.1 DUF2971 domain-containing protein [Clostridium botulinum]NFH60655.1 DUF2971 domain-containing protein [Clostridium botulinum]